MRNRGYLPHLESKRGIYFVTFRLADSLPQTFLGELRGRELSKPKAERRESKEIEEYLDRGVGSCCLKVPRIANIVASALREFDGARYRMLAWCIMPNHVHVVFQSFPHHQLADILHAWKSFTGLEINRQLSRSGAVWQKEYYDHLIRDGQQLKRAIRYTAQNPSRAKLADWPYVYVSAQAFGGPTEQRVTARVGRALPLARVVYACLQDAGATTRRRGRRTGTCGGIFRSGC
jgi:putative transposase